MTIGLLFWIVMLLALVFGVWRWRAGPGDMGPLGDSLIPWLLFFLLGWRVFGFPIQG